VHTAAARVHWVTLHWWWTPGCGSKHWPTAPWSQTVCASLPWRKNYSHKWLHTVPWTTSNTSDMVAHSTQTWWPEGLRWEGIKVHFTKEFPTTQSKLLPRNQLTMAWRTPEAVEMIHLWRDGGRRRGGDHLQVAYTNSHGPFLFQFAGARLLLIHESSSNYTAVFLIWQCKLLWDHVRAM